MSSCSQALAPAMGALLMLAMTENDVNEDLIEAKADAQFCSTVVNMGNYGSTCTVNF